LAAGLYAEVRLIQKRIRKTKKKMEKDNITSFIGTFEHRRDIIGQNVVGESTLARHFSEIDTDIYDRNNDKIGALGVDIARKLVFVYSNARRRGYEKICKLNHEQLYYRLRFINSDKDDLDEDIDKLLEMLSIAAGIDRNQENTDQFIDNS